MHCRYYPSMPCSRSPGGVASQHALQVFRPTPRKFRGLARGGCLQAHTKAEVEGSGLGGGRSPGPHPEGRGFSRPTPRGRGSPGPHPGESWCIPACAEADPPSQRLLLRTVRITPGPAYNELSTVTNTWLERSFLSSKVHSHIMPAFTFFL